jgi:hypothetical protein
MQDLEFRSLETVKYIGYHEKTQTNTGGRPWLSLITHHSLLRLPPPRLLEEPTGAHRNCQGCLDEPLVCLGTPLVGPLLFEALGIATGVFAAGAAGRTAGVGGGCCVGKAGTVGCGGYAGCVARWFGVSHFMLCVYSPIALTSFNIWLITRPWTCDSLSIRFWKFSRSCRLRSWKPALEVRQFSSFLSWMSAATRLQSSTQRIWVESSLDSRRMVSLTEDLFVSSRSRLGEGKDTPGVAPLPVMEPRIGGLDWRVFVWSSS